ncbi:MAG: NAD(P)/FAD-dependent oxidoreductase [Flavobacteriaceae bacterium]|nr:NAD(P)/FAD-dependent oxidoreductase [Flavobacteriaceae bacterium]
MIPKADLIVIGGGAAGFFGAIRYAELNPNARVYILEKGTRVLEKVKISGGGRCNVTHGCFDPKELVKHYPRGMREMLGPFNRFACGDMMEWLSNRGVETKIEDDGRVFPITDNSETIIKCFQKEADMLGVKVMTGEGVTDMKHDGQWEITTQNSIFHADYVLYTTGSSPLSWKLLESLGISLIAPVPSLFTFNIKHSLLRDLPGISVPHAEVSIPSLGIQSFGPLLITHWGLSGPAVLRLSAWGARKLADCKYDADVIVNWVAETLDEVVEYLREQRTTEAKKKVVTAPYPGITRRLWERMTLLAGLDQKNWADLRNAEIDMLADILCKSVFRMRGKSTFKEEFVTAGGVQLDTVSFKTMESKNVKNLWFAGEVLDIDAITGGFNFQAAWTTSWIAAESIPPVH